MDYDELAEQARGDGELLHQCSVLTHSTDKSLIQLELLVWKPRPAESTSLEPEAQEILQRGFLWWALRSQEPCKSTGHSHPFGFVYRGEPVAELSGVIADNALSRSLFEWLALSGDEWWSQAGSISPDYWRVAILQMLRQLCE